MLIGFVRSDEPDCAFHFFMREASDEIRDGIAFDAWQNTNRLFSRSIKRIVVFIEID